MYQITCSTIVQTLDCMVNNRSCVTDSGYGKKKMKLTGHLKSNPSCDLIFKGENALSPLSSLLDVLLFKKDIENRLVLFYTCHFCVKNEPLILFYTNCVKFFVVGILFWGHYLSFFTEHFPMSGYMVFLSRMKSRFKFLLEILTPCQAQ